MDRLLGERHQQITIRVLRLNQRGQIKYLRALQGHASRSESRSNTAGQREDPFLDGRIVFVTSDELGVTVPLSTQVYSL